MQEGRLAWCNDRAGCFVSIRYGHHRQELPNVTQSSVWFDPTDSHSTALAYLTLGDRSEMELMLLVKYLPRPDGVAETVHACDEGCGAAFEDDELLLVWSGSELLRVNRGGQSTRLASNVRAVRFAR